MLKVLHYLVVMTVSCFSLSSYANECASETRPNCHMAFATSKICIRPCQREGSSGMWEITFGSDCTGPQFEPINGQCVKVGANFEFREGGSALVKATPTPAPSPAPDQNASFSVNWHCPQAGGQTHDLPISSSVTFTYPFTSSSKEHGPLNWENWKRLLAPAKNSGTDYFECMYIGAQKIMEE
ncbi:MAG: hypothetical protein AABY86_04290, partial [Bdellovibrionota bacterium]